MSLSKFLNSKFPNDFYIQVWEKRLKISKIDTDQIYDEEPLVAIKLDEEGYRCIFETAGNSAKSFKNQNGYEVVNPFSHPRLLVHDFVAAEKLLKFAFRELNKDKLLVPSSRIIFHPMEKLEGGVTGIEKKVYRELCKEAGAREVIIHVGSELSLYDIDYEELKSKDS